MNDFVIRQAAYNVAKTVKNSRSVCKRTRDLAATYLSKVDGSASESERHAAALALLEQVEAERKDALALVAVLESNAAFLTKAAGLHYTESQTE